MSGPLDDTAVESPGGLARGLHCGMQVGKYRLERELGAGGMGVVWEAHDPDLERTIALKLLRSADADAALRTRLLREARAMARLKHGNVLTVYEVGSEGERDYIAMELVDGTSLDVWLATHPPRRDVVAALLAAGRGLAAAHDAGLVHRDFKPHNVLRRHDGHVLVTDFGLARGVAEGEAPVELAPRPATGGRRVDPVLDSTLTQTGAMIGTPAYMAPEQYAGKTPDPRTDQFAFCVSAWQAVTGERPFTGTTLDELRAAITKGVVGHPGKLPRTLRKVLARGLDPEPDRRWPDMRQLLRALERAARPRAPMIALVVAPVLAVGIAVATLWSVGSGPAKPAAPAALAECEAPDHAFDAAWSPAARTALAAQLAKGGYDDTLARWIDGLRARWAKAYARACTGAPGPVFHQRVGCLLGARDSVASLVDMLQRLPVGELGQFDVFGVAPQLAACDGATPPTPPAMPQDRATRDQIAALHARAYLLREQPTGKLADAIQELETEARALAWPPLVAEVLYIGGAIAHRREDWPLARELMARAAIEASASRDPAVEAQARIDRYEIAIDAAENPRDAFELDRLAKEARAAIRAAGDDATQSAALDVMEARAALLAHHPERVLEHPASPRDAFVAAGDELRAAIATRWVIDAYLARDGDGDLDAARAFLDDTRHKLTGKSTRAKQILDLLGRELMWRRRDPDAKRVTSQIFSGVATGLDQRGTAGIVIDVDGKPVAGAAIYTWSYVLAGTAEGLDGIAALSGQSAADGTFKLEGHGTAIAAEHGDARSAPQSIADGETLRLRPTHVVHGRIIGDHRPPGLDGCVALVGGNAVWIDRVATARDGTFAVARVPEGTWPVCATTGEHTVLGTGGVVRWPSGASLDVITRGGDDGEHVWVFRGVVSPRTVRDAFALAARATDVAFADAIPIGQGTATDAGRAHYEPGDLHVVVDDIAPGPITACAGVAEEADGPVACARHDMHAAGAPPAAEAVVIPIPKSK